MKLFKLMLSAMAVMGLLGANVNAQEVTAPPAKFKVPKECMPLKPVDKTTATKEEKKAYRDCVMAGQAAGSPTVEVADPVME